MTVTNEITSAGLFAWPHSPNGHGPNGYGPIVAGCHDCNTPEAIAARQATRRAELEELAAVQEAHDAHYPTLDVDACRLCQRLADAAAGEGYDR